jgi:nucleoside-diphosphate-sugar epimerase
VRFACTSQIVRPTFEHSRVLVSLLSYLSDSSSQLSSFEHQKNLRHFIANLANQQLPNSQTYPPLSKMSTRPRLPKGSTILVTGVTGYIGSWVAYEALALGYKVRGAVRSLEKAAWLQEHFDSEFGSGQYSQAVLADVSDKAGFEAVVRDVVGIAHIAVNTQLSSDPEPYIPQAIEETLMVLKAAQTERSVASVVLTSSSMAAVAWGASGTIPKDAYNEEFIKLAWDSSFEHPAKMFYVYGAAKAQAEKAAWYVTPCHPVVVEH